EADLPRVDGELTRQRVLVLGIILGIDDAPAVADQLGLARRKGAESLPRLFELQTNGRAAQLGTIHALGGCTQTVEQKALDVLKAVTVSRPARFAAKGPQHVVQ